MHSDVYTYIWFKLGVMIDTIDLHFDTCLIDLDLDLDSRSQECEKVETSAPII